nr:hydrocephalus-inducing protein-like [Nomia melanderi]
MYDAVVAQMAENALAKSALDVYEVVSITPTPEVLSISELTHVTESSAPGRRTGTRRSVKKQRRRSSSKTEERRSLSKLDDRSLNTSTIESRDANNASVAESVLEEPLKPRWILQPNDAQRFKVRFQPTETGVYDEIYGITIADGNTTYEMKISGVADVPTLDMNPQAIFDKPGGQGILTLSAIATKIGTNSATLYLCIKNNPKAEVLQLQSEGAKLNVELDRKQISFGNTLLYRREFQALTIRNRNGTEILWCLAPEEPLDPQITFAPDRGEIKPWDERKIEFCYHGVTVGAIEMQTIVFEAFLQEDQDPIFTETIRLSGQTYDVAVDIDHANPINLERIKVNAPASGLFTMKNRGDYEVQFVVMLEDDEKLSKLNVPVNLKMNLKIRPVSGTIPPDRERVVEVVIVTKTELTLRNAPILKCHLVDTHREAVIVAEIPLTVSLDAYYTRFQLHPYPSMDFGTMAICTEKTMYLNIENTGKFPLHYTIRLTGKHPSMLYLRQTTEDSRKKKNLTARTVASRSKKSVKIKATDVKKDEPADLKLVVGPMTIEKTEGDIDVGQTDTIAVVCYPEFVGSQDEQIMVQVNDSIPEDSDGKIVSLSVRSSVPCVDFEDLDSMFQKNHVVDQIQDFDCPKEIGPHTVFTRQEKCLYFRYVCVSTSHATCFKLYNRNIVPADVQVLFVQDSLTPGTAKPDTFAVDPEDERIPPVSYKTFRVSFTPSMIGTFRGRLEVTVLLPPHLADEKLLVNLLGESCVPEVEIVEPAHGRREKVTLNFARTLVNETCSRRFAVENVGFIKAKVIVEIDEDKNLFSFEACPDTQRLLQIWNGSCDEPNDRCTVVLLMPGNTARFKIRFSPIEIGKYSGKIRLFIVDNPYENLVIDVQAESYMEPIVFEGLEFEDTKRRSKESSELVVKGRKFSSKRSSLTSESLSYVLDYGLCFVGKIYRKTFRIANKSTDKWFRFEWNAHPNLVFVPSIGHVKNQTCKEIVATFLGTEPINHANTRIECIVSEISILQPNNEAAWDDRQTEVRWETLHPDLPEQPKNTEVLAKKTVQPAPEPMADVVPGSSKCIQVLLSATVAFSEYSCPVKDIYFKDTLMFQTREYTFTFSNPGLVNTTYAWKISMDEQYPKKHMEDSANVTSRPRTAENSLSRPNSKSFRGIFSATSERSRYRDFDWHGRSGGDAGDLFSRRCTPSLSGTFEVKPASARRSDLFSSAAGLSERTTDSWLEGDDLPFAIHPEEGSVPPRGSVECTLKFSPVDVFYYKAYLTCKMENLHPELAELSIPVAARSLLPYCHFDVEESDYVTAGRRDPTMPGPLGREPEDPALWENIRVIEFKVVGVGGTHVKSFHLINPTTDDYRFSWTDRTLHRVDKMPNFHCTVPQGVAERGKQTDLAFTFLAEEVGVFESFWLFSIERYNLECLFLLVGIVREPLVHCLTVHVKLKPTILEHSVQESIRLLNDEAFDIPFRILKESLYSEGKFQKLTVIPMTGTLTSKSEQLLQVEYHPSRVGEFHFSIQCAVGLMKAPLTVFVTASAHEIVSSVSYSVAAGGIVRAREDAGNVVDLGKLIVNVPVAVEFDIRNSSKMTFYYTWDLGMTPELCTRNAYSVEMLQRAGHVASESRSTCNLAVTTLQKTVIKDHCVTLKISNGPTYRFLLKATSKKMAVQFSFDRHDFGSCYIQNANGIFHATELRVTNSENKPVILECNYEDQPHLSVDLNPISEAVAARSTVVIPIIFRALKEARYRECLIFKINSRNEKRIVITGEGIPYRIRLVNPRDTSVDLGTVSIGKIVQKKVSMVNEGSAVLNVKFDLTKNLAAYEKYRDREKFCPAYQPSEDVQGIDRASVIETKRSWTVDTELQTKEPRLSEVLQVQPSSTVALHPNKKVDVTVRYKPTCRMRRFTGKVSVQTSSTILPLFVVHGSCVGPEFRLNGTYFSLGTIVEGCTGKAKVVLMNTGDIGARFKWNTSKLPADFTISPVSGYCSPGMDVNFVIKFQPSRQGSLIEGVATVEIEKYDALKIRVTGSCCKLPEPIETVVFACIVRQRETRAMTIANDTNLPWKLIPEVTGNYFSVDEAFHVPAKGSGSCLITYAPTVMNTEDTQHTGTLLIKLPDEASPLVYSLRGNSLPPQVSARIRRQFPAKTKFTELLPVHNWLGEQQRFRCKIESTTSSLQLKRIPFHAFSGNDRIDVPPSSHRDYRAVFHSFEAHVFRFKVTFSNEDGEYQFYEIEYDVTEPEVLESIKLSTPARSRACYSLKLENPLDRDPITYTAACRHPFVAIHDVPKIVPPSSSEHVTVEFHPMLQTEETVVKLDVYCEELGHFPYELRLKAATAFPEKVTRANAILGASCTFPLLVANGTASKAEFTIQVDNDCFATRKQIEVSEFSKGTIEVTFEPYCIENVAATLTASSRTAGIFVFPLMGTSSVPKPCGPYIVSQESPILIRFKNIFKETKTFNFVVDVPTSFAVETQSATLDSKKHIDIKVKLIGNEEKEIMEKYPVAGKLLIYCTDRDHSHINWVYYLRGVFE